MELTLTNAQITRLANAITRIDAANNSEQGAAKAEMPKLNLHPKVIYALGRSLQSINKALAVLEETRNKLIAKYSPTGKHENVAMEDRDKLENEFKQVLDTKTTVNIQQFDVNLLGLDRNPIPIILLQELLDTIVIGDLE